MRHWRNAIYIVQSLEGLAGGLVNIFIPIYFLTLGYSIKEIFLYLIINNVSILLFFFLAGWLAEHFGLVNTIFMRLPVLFVYLFLLYGLNDKPWAFYVISVLSALEIAMYWFVVNIIFADNADKNEMGSQVAKFFAYPALVGMFMPLVGASILALLGFKVLFVVVALIYGASVVPLVITDRDARIFDFSMRSLSELWLSVRRILFREVNISYKKVINLCFTHKKYFGAEFFLSLIGEIEGYILPIFLFLTYKDILSIGKLAAFLSLGSALFTLFIGKYSDKFDKRHILRAGAVALMLVWLGRYLASTQIQFYILSILAGFFAVLVSVPFHAILYRNAKDTSVSNFIIFREIPTAIARTLTYLIGLLLLAKIKWTFVLAALSYSYLLFF